MKIKFVSRQIAYPFLTSIFYFFQNYLCVRTTYEIGHFMSFIFLLTFPLFFSIIPEDIIAYHYSESNRIKQTHIELKINPNRGITRVRMRNHCSLKYLWVIVVGVCRFVSTSLFRYFINLSMLGYTMPVTYSSLILTWALSFIFFKEKIGRHRIVSIGILGIFCLFECLYCLKNLEKEIIDKFSNMTDFVCILILETLTLSAKEVTERHLMIKYFMSPYLLLLYEGIISSIVIIIVIIIFTYSNCTLFGNFDWLCKSNNWSRFSSNMTLLFNFTNLNTLFSWALIIVGIPLNFLRIYMNKEQTSTHRYISDNMANFYFLIFKLFCVLFATKLPNQNLTETCVLIGIEVFAIIVYFIFNEHIILYFFGLEIDTKEEIQKRAEIEQELVISLADFTEEENIK